MTRLNLHDFDIKGSIDGPFRTWSKVSILVVSDNELTGSIPDALNVDNPELSELVLSRNRFGGQIPESVADLSLLTIFRIDDNVFSGSLPQNLGVNTPYLGTSIRLFSLPKSVTSSYPW